jgi:hypothetical protein
VLTPRGLSFEVRCLALLACVAPSVGISSASLSFGGLVLTRLLDRAPPGRISSILLL